MTSPLHAALGQPGSDLTMQLLREVCEQQVGETDQLDFKRDLPLSVGPSSNEEARSRTLELAKDLAAMANGRGGVIVYGIRDEGDRAAALEGVRDLSDGVMEKRIHQVAYNFVYPPLQLRCVPLLEGELSALVVEVPESDQAPHLVQPRRDGGNDGWFMAPYRAGPDTQNMVEKQLEAAYRRRIDVRRERVRQLRESLEELGQRHIGASDRDTGTVLALARPIRPRSGPLSEDSALLARQIAQQATVLASQLAGELRLDDRFPITLLSEATTPRRGLRRHVFSATRRMRDEHGEHFPQPVYVALELHDDGTIGLVWRRGPGYSFVHHTSSAPPTPAIGQADMNIMGILLLSLVLTAHRELRLTTDYQVRAVIAPNEAIRLIPREGWADHDYPQVPAPPALEAELRMDNGPDVRAADFLALGQDLVNMVEQSYSAIEGFWELPRGSQLEHPRRALARNLFGGEPDHPIRGSAMA